MHVTVLGGGISGLSTAYFLRQLCPHVGRITLLESSRRLGGWMHSSHREDDLLFDKACRSIRPQGRGADIVDMVYELGLVSQALPSSDDAKRRYIWFRGQLHEVPSTPASFMRWPLVRRKWRSILQDILAPKNDEPDESVHDFFTRRFGSDVATNVIDPMISGIYAGDTSRLSMRAVFPKIFSLEREHGSLMKGMLFGNMTDLDDKPQHASKAGMESVANASSLSFVDGVESLPRGLAKWLETNDVEIVTCAQADAIRMESDGAVNVSYTSGPPKARAEQFQKTLRADHAFVATPANATARILPSSCDEAVKHLLQIPFSSVAAVNMSWSPTHGDVLQGRRGFGYLVPTSQWDDGGESFDRSKSANTPTGLIPGVLGMTWDSCVFPDQATQHPHSTRTTVMVGGAKFPEIETMSEPEVELLAVLAAREHLGIQQEPDNVQVNLARQAIPQYTLGHVDRLDAIRAQLKLLLPRVELVGNSYDGIGVADCVRNAKLQVKQFKEHTTL